MASLDRNERFLEAVRLLGETDRSLFITGGAGTGESTLLSRFCETARKKRVALAPTPRSVQGPDPARAGGRGAVFARIGKHVIAGIIEAAWQSQKTMGRC